jgi:hypothetical protein
LFATDFSRDSTNANLRYHEKEINKDKKPSFTKLQIPPDHDIDAIGAFIKNASSLLIHSTLPEGGSKTEPKIRRSRRKDLDAYVDFT